MTFEDYPERALPKNPDREFQIAIAVAVGLCSLAGAVAGVVGAFTLRWLGG